MTRQKSKMLEANGIGYATGHEKVDLSELYFKSGFLDAK